MKILGQDITGLACVAGLFCHTVMLVRDVHVEMPLHTLYKSFSHLQEKENKLVTLIVLIVASFQ